MVGSVFCLFSLENSMLLETENGGEAMDEDYEIFEMFLELVMKLEADDPDGRMRILSHNPRFDEDAEKTAEKNRKHKR